MRAYGVENYRGKFGSFIKPRRGSGFRSRICTCCMSRGFHKKSRKFKKRARSNNKKEMNNQLFPQSPDLNKGFFEDGYD